MACRQFAYCLISVIRLLEVRSIGDCSVEVQFRTKPIVAIVVGVSGVLDVKGSNINPLHFGIRDA